MLIHALLVHRGVRWVFAAPVKGFMCCAGAILCHIPVPIHVQSSFLVVLYSSKDLGFGLS